MANGNSLSQLWYLVMIGTALALASLGCSANDAAAKLLSVPTPAEQQRLQAELEARMPEATVLVLPVYFRDRDTWVPAGEFAELLKPYARSVVLDDQPPKIARNRVPPTSYRYWGRRTQQFRTWIKTASPAADFIVFTEIYSDRVPRSQLFVMDRSGRLMRGRSVHWGHNPPRDLRDAAERVMGDFTRGMDAINVKHDESDRDRE